MVWMPSYLSPATPDWFSFYFDQKGKLMKALPDQ
jgi:hypothetical protein